MKFSLALATALATVASATYSNVTYTTVVVDTYTTVCPEATQLTFNGVTYTVTASQTLTVTNCPCTISKPVYTTPVVYCSSCANPVASSVPVNNTVPVVYSTPVVYTTPVIAPPAGTNPAVTYGSSPATTSKVSYTGAANKVAIGSAALVGLAGAIAVLL